MQSKIENPKSKIQNRPLGPGLRFDFSLEHSEQEVGRIIGAHQGAAMAISIESIAQELWPTEWWLISNDPTGHPTYPRRKSIQREIKQCVRNLRRAGIKIASNRGANFGYYMITNARELADTVAPMLRQAVDELRTIEALTGKGYYAAELAGQEKLFKTVASG